MGKTSAIRRKKYSDMDLNGRNTSDTRFKGGPWNLPCFILVNNDMMIQKFYRKDVFPELLGEHGVSQYIDNRSYFRSMTPDDDGLPRIGRSARLLGVRAQEIPADENGFVKPGTGGMSVAPDSMWNVPNHRRPRGMKRGSAGNINDRMYTLTDASLPADKLRVRVDPQAPQRHAFVEPAAIIELAGYENHLADTRNDWRQVWP